MSDQNNAFTEALSSPEASQNQEEQVLEDASIESLDENMDEDEEVEDLIEKPSNPIGTPNFSEVDYSGFIPRMVKTTMHVKCNHYVKKKLGITKHKFKNVSVYTMTAGSRLFDSLLRRGPQEVLPIELPAENYLIPLGGSCAQTCVSLYGLSNYELFNWRVWKNAMGKFIVSPTADNINDVLTVLRASAVKKVLTVSAAEANLVRGFDLESLYFALSIDDTLINAYFFDMML